MRTHRTGVRVLAGAAGDQVGSVLLFVVVTLPVLIGVASLAIDVATVWSARQRAQSAADAAALAGADDLTSAGSSTAAIKDAKAIFAQNDPYATPNVTYNSTSNSITVTASQNVGMAFGGEYHLSSAAVQGGATASDSVGANIGENITQAEYAAGSPNDGYLNFCAADGLVDSSNTTHNGMCSVSTYSSVLGAWAVLGGSVDIFDPVNGSDDTSKWNYTLNSIAQPVVDLVGTCAEDENAWGSSSGYCDNNADAELATAVPTAPGTTYTITFTMVSDSSTPDSMPFELLVSSFDLFASGSTSKPSTAKPLTSTRGTSSGTNCSSTITVPATCWYDGTEVPSAGAPTTTGTPTDLTFTSFASNAQAETKAWIVSNGGSSADVLLDNVYDDPSQAWLGTSSASQVETATFTATGYTTDVAFIALQNCADDSSPSSADRSAESSAGSVVTDSNCDFGAGIADFSIIGYGNASLTG